MTILTRIGRTAIATEPATHDHRRKGSAEFIQWYYVNAPPPLQSLSVRYFLFRSAARYAMGTGRGSRVPRARVCARSHVIQQAHHSLGGGEPQLIKHASTSERALSATGTEVDRHRSGALPPLFFLCRLVAGFSTHILIKWIRSAQTIAITQLRLFWLRVRPGFDWDL